MRLATLNLLHGRSLSDGLVDLARVSDAVRSLGADVLGLQEVDRDQPRSHGLDLTAEAARAVGAPHARFAPALLGTPGGDWEAASDADGTGPAYGVGLVSRLPVAEWRTLRFRAAPVRAPVLVPGTARPLLLRDEPRVAVAAVVETAAGPMTVATTHLSFVPGWNGVQLRWLRDGLADLPRPLVLVGDLNMPSRVPRWLTGWRSLVRTPTYPADGPRVQLDHALADGRLPGPHTAEAVALPISDHRALVVDLPAA